MANPDSLIPGNHLTPEEARIAGRKGGLLSGAARRRAKTLKEAAQMCLELRCPGEVIELLKKKFPDLAGDITMREAATLMQMIQAVKGEIRSYETVRDTAGEKPVDKQAFVDPEGEPLKSPLIQFTVTPPKPKAAEEPNGPTEPAKPDTPGT